MILISDSSLSIARRRNDVSLVPLYSKLLTIIYSYFYNYTASAASSASALLMAAVAGFGIHMD